MLQPYKRKTENVHWVCQWEVTGGKNESSHGNEPDFSRWRAGGFDEK